MAFPRSWWWVAISTAWAALMLPAPAALAQQQQQQQQQPNLAVSVSGRAQAEFGASVTYVVTLRNLGDAAASGVLMQDTLARAIIAPSFSSSGGLSCAWLRAARFAGTTLQCSGRLSAGAAATVTLGGLAPGFATTVSSLAVADPFNQRTTALATTQVAAAFLPDLVIDASGVPDTTLAGQEFTSTLRVSNIGAVRASNVTVRDSLPSGSSFVSAATSAGFACSAAASVVSCVGGALDSRVDAQVSIQARAPRTPGQYTTEIVVDPENAIAESNETNNAAAGVMTVAGELPDLAVSVVAVPDPVDAGQQFVLSFNVANIGNAPASSIDLEGRFTRVAWLTASSSSGLICQPTYTRLKGGSLGSLSGVACTGGSLAAGESATVALTLRADSAPRTWTVGATVDPSNAIAESNEINNAVTETVTFR